jgi:hypothetical protein
MKQMCKFINLRDAITFFPDDKKLLGLANRFHNFQAIRNDLRKAHNLLGEVIRFQNQEKLLASPHLFSAGWFYAVILYARSVQLLASLKPTTRTAMTLNLSR